MSMTAFYGGFNR